MLLGLASKRGYGASDGKTTDGQSGICLTIGKPPSIKTQKGIIMDEFDTAMALQQGTPREQSRRTLLWRGQGAAPTASALVQGCWCGMQAETQSCRHIREPVEFELLSRIFTRHLCFGLCSRSRMRTNGAVNQIGLWSLDLCEVLEPWVQGTPNLDMRWACCRSPR